MKTNAEKLIEVRAALETLKARMAKFTEGVPSSLTHEEQRLQGMIDWYEQAEADRIAREKVPTA